MISSKKLSRHQKAKLAEAAVLFRLCLHGFATFGSVFDGDKTDWLIEIPKSSTTKKIQVKWAIEQRQGLPNISLKCTEGHNKQRKYRDGECDFIIAYDFFSDICYVFPWDVVKGGGCKTIDPAYAERWDLITDR